LTSSDLPLRKGKGRHGASVRRSSSMFVANYRRGAPIHLTLWSKARSSCQCLGQQHGLDRREDAQIFEHEATSVDSRHQWCKKTATSPGANAALTAGSKAALSSHCPICSPSSLCYLSG
jgi:hypothetical protein